MSLSKNKAIQKLPKFLSEAKFQEMLDIAQKTNKSFRFRIQLKNIFVAQSLEDIQRCESEAHRS